jgi:HTH-type transcriptional regulator/antitoxin HipB
MDKNEAIRNAKNFDEALDIEYGKVGTGLRGDFEEKAMRFVVCELLNDVKRKANITIDKRNYSI